MKEQEIKIAKDLLKIRAVFLRPDEPFIWASGIKSPIYCDNRLTLTAPEVINDVENALAEVIKKYYPEAEVLMGTSTAGIAHAAITGHILNMPMGYVRAGAKDHGSQIASCVGSYWCQRRITKKRRSKDLLFFVQKAAEQTLITARSAGEKKI